MHEDSPSVGQETAAFDFVVTEADQRSFAALSGDLNPLHLDPGFARARGLAGSVVYGGLIIAKISQLIGMRIPGPAGIWATLNIDFREPLYVGETAHLDACISHRSESTGTLTIKINVTCGTRTIATAKALAKLLNVVAGAHP